MRFSLKSLSLVAFFTAANVWAAPTAEQIEFFEKHIRPVLAEHCYKCHNSSGKAKSDLALDWRGGWMVGGDSGPVIKLGKPAESFLLRVIRHQEKDLKMPKDGPKLSPPVIKNFERWIAMGAPDPRLKSPTKEQITKAKEQRDL